MDSNEIQEQLNEIERIKKVRELSEKIKDIKVAMVTTSTLEGDSRSRPMHTLEIKDDGVIWFLTSKESNKAKEIEANPIISLSYSDLNNNLYVSLSGVASLTDDQMKIDELWTEMFKAWFPAGKTDPNITLLRIDPTKAEYWDTPNSVISQIILVVKASIKGNPYLAGENKKIAL